jgi:hypothetical protein
MIGGGRWNTTPRDKAKEFGFRHTHTMAGRCVMCGRQRTKQKRKPEVVAMTLRKGWRLIARPLSFRVQKLAIPSWGSNGNPVWTDVQRCPRTRNAWLDDELMCAVSMFHRRFREWERSIVIVTEPEPKLTRLQRFALKFLEWKDRL